jgi:hypothetical protein
LGVITGDLSFLLGYCHFYLGYCKYCMLLYKVSFSRVILVDSWCHCCQHSYLSESQLKFLWIVSKPDATNLVDVYAFHKFGLTFPSKVTLLTTIQPPSFKLPLIKGQPQCLGCALHFHIHNTQRTAHKRYRPFWRSI